MLAWLHGRTIYPEEARRQGIQGRVVVRFSIARDGTIGDVMVARGSDAPILNQAALSILRGARAPAFTSDMAGERITVTVPITFALTR